MVTNHIYNNTSEELGFELSDEKLDRYLEI